MRILLGYVNDEINSSSRHMVENGTGYKVSENKLLLWHERQGIICKKNQATKKSNKYKQIIEVVLGKRSYYINL